MATTTEVLKDYNAGEETFSRYEVAALLETISTMRKALECSDACFDTLDPRQPSGLSDAETASMFNATRENVRLALNYQQ